MFKELVEDPQFCIEYLYKMLEGEIIGKKTDTTFGQWYFYENLVRSTYVVICHSLLYVILVIYNLKMKCLSIDNDMVCFWDNITLNCK